MTSGTPEEMASQVAHTREKLGETVERLAAKTDVKARAQEKAAEFRHTAREKTSHATHAVHEMAGHATHAAREKTAHAAHTVQDTAREKAPPKPVLTAAVAAVGVAVGTVAAVASVRRRKRVVVRRFGPVTVVATMPRAGRAARSAARRTLVVTRGNRVRAAVALPRGARARGRR